MRLIEILASAWDHFGLKYLLVLQLFLSTGYQSWKRPGDKVENWNRALWRDGRVWDRSVIKILFCFFFPYLSNQYSPLVIFLFFFFSFFRGDGLGSVSFALVVHINKDGAMRRRRERDRRSEQLFIYKKWTCTKSQGPFRMFFTWARLPESLKHGSPWGIFFTAGPL